MKFLGFDNVLVLSPHPDDAEYSMSSTMKKFTDTEFSILCLSVGGDFDKTTSKKRWNEVEGFWKSMDIDNCSLFFINDGFISDKKMDEWISTIEVYLKDKKYDAIVGPSELDSHFEHRFVSDFLKTLSRKHHYSIIQYKSPSTYDEWIPNLYITIDEENLNKKIDSLNIFESQLKHSYFNPEHLKMFHIHWNTTKRGLKYTEQFKIITLYG